MKDGRYYPSKAPLLSFAAVPIYAALRALGGGSRYAVGELPLVYFARLFLTVLPTLLMLRYLRRLLSTYVDAPVADAITATYALGSLALSYSLLFMSHQTSAVLVFAAFFCLWRTLRERRSPGNFALAGAFAGAAFAAEYTSAIAILGIALYGALALLSAEGQTAEKVHRAMRALAFAVAGAAPFALGLMLYQRACFGHPLHTGYRYLADAAYQPWHSGGLFGIRLPDARAFWLSLFSPLRGLFALAPFLLLAFFGLPVLFRRSRAAPSDRALFWMTVTLLGLYGYFTASFSYESWGWTTGPRHLTTLVPFLVLPIALAVQSFKQRSSARTHLTQNEGQIEDAFRLESATRRITLGAAAGLCAASVLITGLVSLVNYIPDSASNALFGLALPLFRAGYWPPTVGTLLGATGSWPGMLLVAAVICAALLIVLVLLGFRPVRARSAPWALPIAASVCAIWLFGLALATDPRRDAGALGHLESAWLTQNAGSGTRAAAREEPRGSGQR